MLELNHLDRLSFLDVVSSFLLDRFCFLDLKVARFIACQAALESDYGNSNIAIENKNIIGMKLPKYRLSTAIGVNRGHAVYPSFEACLCDYMYWLQYYDFSQKTCSSYTVFIRRFKRCNYCPNPDYVDRILSIYNIYYKS